MLTVGIEEIEHACRRAGIEQRPVCIHASLRSFGWVRGGGATVVRGLLASGCTVMTPTFAWAAYAVPPPEHLRPARNGWDYAYVSRKFVKSRIFTPDSRALDAEMGAVPAALLAEPERLRSTHPLCSFAACGPLAATLVVGQRPDDVFAPLRRLAELDGSVVLMGVGLNRMTLLHEAEKQAGRTLFRRWACDVDGQAAMFEVGGCSEGFERFAPLLVRLEQRITVGRSVWRIYPAAAALEQAAQAIAANPEITRCADVQCSRCRDGIAGGPILVLN